MGQLICIKAPGFDKGKTERAEYVNPANIVSITTDEVGDIHLNCLHWQTEFYKADGWTVDKVAQLIGFEIITSAKV